MELETAERLGRTPRTAGEARIAANQYADIGNYPKAITLYQQAIAEDPGDLETYLKLGIVHFYLGDNEGARRYIGEVTKRTDLTLTSSYMLIKPILDALGMSGGPQ